MTKFERRFFKSLNEQAEEERAAFEAELDAEVERSRAGDRSGLNDALQLY